jgi:alpha-beta hydrolase superfamily lysophospholipase
MNIDKESGIMFEKWTVANPDSVLLLVHGLGAHSYRWLFLADFFKKNNISSYSIELKGFGETKDLKGHIGSFKIYYKDILSLLDIIKKENPSKKVFILGESMGGLIAFMMAALYPDLFGGLICISPAFANRMKFSLLDYISIFSSPAYNPKKQFTMPFNSKMCTRDSSYQKIMDSSPREHRLATSKLLLNILIEQIRGSFLKDKIRIPVLFLLAGEDKLVNPAATEKVFNNLKVKDKKMIKYPEMFHALSIEIGRERVFQDILGWMNVSLRGA